MSNKMDAARAWVSVLGIASLLAGAVRADQVDQQCLLSNGGHNPYAYEPFGQSFVPSAAQNTGVDLWVQDWNGWSAPLSPLTVRIREGSISGVVLADSTVTPPAGIDGWVHFPLSFNAMPGHVYVIDIYAANLRWGLQDTQTPIAGIDGYPSGEEYLSGVAIPTMDLDFRIWVTPEPATLALLALGLTVVGRRCRRPA